MTTATWFTNLEAKAEAALAKLVAEGEAEAKVIYDAVEPVVVTDFEAFLEAIGEIALGAVMQQAPLVISGTEKFGAAVATVVQTVETQGKPIEVADAQMAVQGAYNALRVAVSKNPATATAPTAASAPAA